MQFRKIVGTRRALSLLVIIYVALGFHPVDAQEAPPVLDPGAIFTGAVEVVETLPILNADNESKLLWYFDPASNSWRSYPYPDGWDEIQRPALVNDRYYVSSDYFWHPTTDNVRIFNPVSGSYSVPSPVCGDLVGDLTTEWQIIYQSSNDNYYLCNTITGERTSSLPKEITSNLSDTCVATAASSIYLSRTTSPVISPDRDWLIFSDCSQDTDQTLYSYEFSSGTINNLGNIIADSQSDILPIEIWGDDHTALVDVLLLGQEVFSPYHPLFTVNVQQAQSLKFIAGQSWHHPKVYTNPTRIIWADVDFTQHVLNVYQYDLKTEDQRLIFQSPCGDSENAILSCVDSEVIFNPDNTLLAIRNVDDSNNFEGKLLIFDLSMSMTEVLYSRKIYLNSELEWVDNQSFLIKDAVSFYDKIDTGNQKAVLVRLNEGDITETEFTYDSPPTPNIFFLPSLSPDKDYFLALNSQDSPQQMLSKFDLFTGEITPLFKNFDEAQFKVWFSWEENNLLEIHISDAENASNVTANWIIRIKP